jgi:hypothetical protein
MSEKIMVRRSLAIALGIICIVLMAAVAAFSLVINGKDNAIDSLNSQVIDLRTTLYFGKEMHWIENLTVGQPAGSYSSWTFRADNAGYVSVWVLSDTNNTYVRVIYTCAYVPTLHYDNQVNVGTNGTVCFPVLPSSGVEIRVGNTNTLNNATETIANIQYNY